MQAVIEAENPIKTSQSPIEKALNSYPSYGLKDLDKAALMDRVDSKFLIPTAILPQVLQRIEHHYAVLEIAEQRIFHYANTYYDTADYRFYHDHHNGKINRYKVRLRTYTDTATSFLEVKFKNNKKRTIKKRIQVTEPLESFSSEALTFLEQQGLNNGKQLKAVQQGNYQRISLANESDAERLTIDSNLYFSEKPVNNIVHLNNYVIAELKQSKLSRNSPFFEVMRDLGLRPTSFSKYCMGLYLCGSSTRKHNNFKKIARQIRFN